MECVMGGIEMYVIYILTASFVVRLPQFFSSLHFSRTLSIPMPRRLTETLQNDINSAVLSRRSPEDIASELGVHPTTVRRYARKLGQNQPISKGGRPTIVSLRTKKYIKLSVIRGHLRTAREVHRQLLEFGYNMSYSSAINVLKSMNFFAARKIKKPFLTLKHMKQRLQWAKEHKNWTVERWRQVIFSDETKVNIWGSDGCKYYWKRPGDPLQPHHVEVIMKHGGGSVIMWSCMTSEGAGYACQVYDGAMDSATYQHILGTTLKDSVDYYGINWPSWYFQQDNDPKHKSKSTLKWLQDNRVNVISDWPAQSPDLNPMEHIWRQLKLNLSLYKTHAKNTQELWERIEKEWNKFDKDLCCKYIDTMPDRIRAVIKSKGGYTKY